MAVLICAWTRLTPLLGASPFDHHVQTLLAFSLPIVDHLHGHEDLGTIDVLCVVGVRDGRV